MQNNIHQTTWKSLHGPLCSDYKKLPSPRYHCVCEQSSKRFQPPRQIVKTNTKQKASKKVVYDEDGIQIISSDEEDSESKPKKKVKASITPLHELIQIARLAEIVHPKLFGSLEGSKDATLILVPSDARIVTQDECRAALQNEVDCISEEIKETIINEQKVVRFDN